MAKDSGSLPVCRFCLEDSVEEGDEFLAPCRCSGSVKYVHRSCLDKWRISGFDPKTVTHCGMCQAPFRLEQVDSGAFGPEAEVWLQIGRYLAWRLGIFLLIVILLGFLPRYLLSAEDMPQIFRNRVLNHLTLGSASTLALTGGYAVLQVLWSVNFLHLRPERLFGGSRDSWSTVLVILIVVGACFLLYRLAVGIWEIATVGRQVATAHLRHANRTMRTQIVERHRVLDFDPLESTHGPKAAREKDAAAAGDEAPASTQAVGGASAGACSE